MSMPVVVAHVGHWIADLMYVAPVLAIVVWISIRSMLDRRQQRREQAEADAGRARDGAQDSRSSSATS